MPTAAVRDIEIYHEIRGSGPPVLLISGTGGDLRNPSTFADRLAERATVLAYDQRNLGRTTILDQPTTMAAYAADAVALVDHVGWDRFGVVGISFGGMVAQEAALLLGDRVTRLVLAVTSAGGAGGSSYPLHTLEPLDDPIEAARRQVRLGNVRADDAWEARHPEAARAVYEDVAAMRTVGADEPLREAGAFRQLEARAGHDTWDRLPDIAVPTLVTAGRFDGIAPPPNAEALAARIPGAELSFHDAGHALLGFHPGATDEAIDFVVGG